jgi:predicted transcriptional regulator
MVQLYSARTRLLSIFQSPDFLNASIASSSIIDGISFESIIFRETISVREAFAIFADMNSHHNDAVVYSENGAVVGVLRREPVERIAREEREEALTLPISSLVTRSFIPVEASISWYDLLRLIKEERVLSVVVKSGDSKDIFGMTVNSILYSLNNLIFEENSSEDYNDSVTQMARLEQ